jgi:hypothetical protein
MTLKELHSTLTFDFVAVIKDSVRLKLDSGEEKTLENGDIVLQKGTNHVWTNPHPTEWARFYVGLEPVPVFDGSTTGTDGFGPVHFGFQSLPSLGRVQDGFTRRQGPVPGRSTASMGVLRQHSATSEQRCRSI